MTPSTEPLRGDFAAVRAAAIDAVRPETLLPRRLAVAGGRLLLDGVDLDPPLTDLGGRGRIAVVGGGKAAAGMAAAIERILEGTALEGLVSVPEGRAAVGGLVEVRATRPAAANLPTAAAVAATREMLDRLGTLGRDDLAIVLASGGGSALVALPRAGLPLAEKIAVTEFLSGTGAGIRELNVVRQAASAVKGGGLARGCTAGRMLVLVLSDVLGDPLESIASGPCMPLEPLPEAALAVLRRHGAIAAGVAPTLVRLLEEDVHRHGGAAAAGTAGRGSASAAGSWVTPGGCRVDHVVIGSNATAVAAAAAAARAAGYETLARESRVDEPAEAVGRRLAAEAAALVAAVDRDGRPRAIVEGGEATVVVPRDHGRGGRNQQTALAAVAAATSGGRPWPPGLLVASIGTDGEDGPTDAAGGCVDAAVAAAITAAGLDVDRALARCDAAPFLEACGGLVQTGPTGTNVADVRIVIARP
jgi:glycerate-2-kinase